MATMAQAPVTNLKVGDRIQVPCGKYRETMVTVAGVSTATKRTTLKLEAGTGGLWRRSYANNERVLREVAA